MLNKLKGMLFDEDSSAAPGQPAAAVPPKPMAGSPVPMTAPSHGPNEAMVEAIRKATFARNTALTTLIQQAENFKEIIPDPAMRMKAAHKASGSRSSKEISDAVIIHLNDVDGEVTRFSQTIESKIKAEVGGLTATADQQERQIAAMNNEVAQLNERLIALQTNLVAGAQKLSDLRAEASMKEADLRSAEVDFKGAADVVRAELNGHKANIVSTLG